MSAERRALEVYYDGACPLCRREIAAYRRAIPEGDVTWVDIAADADRAPPEVGRDALLARFHVRRADGRLVSGAAAFFAVWRNLRRLRLVADLLDRPPFIWLAEIGYRLFLAIRPLWRRRRASSR